MAVTNFSPLLGLALPTTGDLSGTWGTVVNDAITGLLDSAIAGTTTLSADVDVRCPPPTAQPTKHVTRSSCGPPRARSLATSRPLHTARPTLSSTLRVAHSRL